MHARQQLALRLKRTLSHARRVDFVAFAEGRYLLSASYEDGCVRLWDPQTLELLVSYSLRARG